MGSTSTVYDVRVKYSLDDKASQGVKSIATSTQRAAESAFSLKSALAAVGGVALLHKGKELLLDFNSEMDKLKIGMTTVMQMNMHMPFEKAAASADKLFETFQAMAKKSPLMTKDFMEMASAIAPAVSMAGGGVGKLEKMTQGALQAGLAFNVRPDQMSMDIQEMLAGNVRLTSRTARQLLASQGLDHNEFNQKSGKERAQITEKILTDPALLQASERAAHTMAGEISTLKDNIQIAFGEIGKPLVHEITEEIKRWNVWIEKHPKQIKEWMNTFSDGLKKGFAFLKSVGEFFVEHKDLLISLAKTFVVFKGAQMAGNIFQKFTTGVSGLAESLQNGIATLRGGGGVGGLVSSMGGLSSMATGIFTKVIPALAAFHMALEVATHFLGQNSEAERKAKENAMSLNEATGEIPAARMRIEEIRNNLSKNAASFSDDDKARMQAEIAGLTQKAFGPEAVGLALRKIQEASAGKFQSNGNPAISLKDTPLQYLTARNVLGHLPDTFDRSSVAANTKIMQDIEGILKSFEANNEETKKLILKYAFPEQYGMPTPKEAPAPSEDWGGLSSKDVNVTIQKVEVASEDPDRFVFGLVQLADQALKHSTQSQHTIAGGF